MAKIKLNGSWIHPNLVLYFKNFDDFYKWGQSKFDGNKKEFEDIYYKYHVKKAKGGGDD